jgi:hypothetical protein
MCYHSIFCQNLTFGATNVFSKYQEGISNSAPGFGLIENGAEIVQYQRRSKVGTKGNARKLYVGAEAIGAKPMELFSAEKPW